MKIKKTKRFIAVIGAGLATAVIMTACSDSGNEIIDPARTESVSGDPSSTETTASGAQDTETETSPAAASEQTAETESAVADVYGDGVDPVTAKSSENGLGFLRDRLKETVGTMCGFAYLGSVGEGATVKDVTGSSATAANFVFIKEMDTEKIVSDGGNDIFIFVPTDENAKVVINTFAESDNGKSIYTSERGNPVLIRTKDELNDSMEIIITDSAGNVGHFAPDITTGNIADTIYKDVTGYNFSADVDASIGLNKQYLIDSLLWRNPALSDMLSKGEEKISEDSFGRIYIDGIEFYTLDFGHEVNGKFVKDYYYAVSKDATLMYVYDTAVKDWMELQIHDWNAEQYK